MTHAETHAETHAVVLGAGFAGLVTARVLADHFTAVTIVERDDWAGVGPRRGVPQGRHAHAFLAKGYEILETLYPGVTEELFQDGARHVDFLADVRFGFHGHVLTQVPTGLQALLASRPFFEGHLRRRTLALPNVRLLGDHEVTGVTTERRAVTGVRICPRGRDRERTLAADLVVDCLGRSGRSTAWLDELGFARPREERTRVDLTYASRHLRLSGTAPSGDRIVVVGAQPGRPTGLALSEQERGQWVLSLYGYGTHAPPADPEGFLEFARRLAPPDVWAVIRDAEPLDDVAVYRFAHCTRRRYDRLADLPAGMVAVGDSQCSLNPVYGAGMTSAALQALALGRCLRGMTPAMRAGKELPKHYYRASARLITQPWWFSVLGDHLLPEVPGKRLPGMALIRRHLLRMLSAAEHDGYLATAVMEAFGLVAPAHRLVAPRALMHTWRPGR
ncbi:FAD-dependent oxidoreductase [Kitasatospora sp. NPDC050543]|uniref:FAD-dependent oxidoreductase n=1 Tax=Kitasatospora sp. NPDC050543 TaxID=3364054 RepID=UPI00378E8C64